MDITVRKVKGYLSPNKVCLLYEGEPFLILNSDKHVPEILKYLEGFSADISDKKVLKILELLKEGKGVKVKNV